MTLIAPGVWIAPIGTAWTSPGLFRMVPIDIVEKPYLCESLLCLEETFCPACKSSESMWLTVPEYPRFAFFANTGDPSTARRRTRSPPSWPPTRMRRTRRRTRSLPPTPSKIWWTPFSSVSGTSHVLPPLHHPRRHVRPRRLGPHSPHDPWRCVMSHDDELFARVAHIERTLMDEGLIVEAGWQGFRLLTIPPTVSPAQLEFIRSVFFAGAQHLFGSIMTGMDEGTQETEADLRRMDNIQKELDRFLVEFKKRHGLK